MQLVQQNGRFTKFASVPIALLQFGTIWEWELSNPNYKLIYTLFRFFIRHILVTGPIIFCTTYIMTNSSNLTVSRIV